MINIQRVIITWWWLGPGWLWGGQISRNPRRGRSTSIAPPKSPWRYPREQSHCASARRPRWNKVFSQIHQTRSESGLQSCQWPSDATTGRPPGRGAVRWARKVPRLRAQDPWSIRLVQIITSALKPTHLWLSSNNSFWLPDSR